MTFLHAGTRESPGIQYQFRQPRSPQQRERTPWQKAHTACQNAFVLLCIKLCTSVAKALLRERSADTWWNFGLELNKNLSSKRAVIARLIVQ